MLENHNAPNPQFARKHWIDLTGRWRFSYDDEDAGTEQGWWQSDLPGDLTITVPYPPESELSGIGDYGFHPVVWYQRDLEVPDDWHERTLIHFGAVDYAATVWIDTSMVGQHEGGSSPFTIDVSTDWLRSLDRKVITLRTFDDPRDLEQPRGKQSWTPEPESIFYKRTTGIWQPVWLESAPERYILGYHATFNADDACIDFEVEINAPPADSITLTVHLEYGNKRLNATADAEDRIVSLRMQLGDVDPDLLWSPAQPTLLPLTLLLDSGDHVESYLGLRTLELDQHGYRINGERVWPRMVLHQGYWPQSHLSAPSAEAIQREVEVTLELGFSGARTHQKAEDPRYLYWADRRGLLLWGEIGAAYKWSDLAINRLSNEWAEIVRRDRNHPSIISWTPFNESWGIADVAREDRQQHAVRSLVAQTRALDPTRPVIGNDGWEHVTTDILTIHDYEWSGAELGNRYGDQLSNTQVAAGYHVADKVLVATDLPELDTLPRMVTEYGGVSFAPAASEQWYGYGKVRTAEEFEAKYRELTQALHGIDALIGVCYTQLADTEQETNGLLTADREPKIDLETIRAINQGDRNP